MDNKQLLNIASKLGYSLLENSAEIYRVEESVSRVLKAYGAVETNVFVINSCMMLSLKTESGEVLTDIKRCTSKATDIYKIQRLNNLSRKICSGKMEYDEIIAELDEINSKKPYPYIVRLLGFAVVSAGFCLVFNGNFIDALAALFISFLVYPTMSALDSVKSGIFFKNIIASAFIALLTILISAFVVELHIDKVIIGTFMNLVPGVALVTSMRDIIAGDLISGKNTLTEALIIALGMALGAGISMTALGFLI